VVVERFLLAKGYDLHLLFTFLPKVQRLLGVQDESTGP